MPEEATPQRRAGGGPHGTVVVDPYGRGLPGTRGRRRDRRLHRPTAARTADLAGRGRCATGRGGPRPGRVPRLHGPGRTGGSAQATARGGWGVVPRLRPGTATQD